MTAGRGAGSELHYCIATDAALFCSTEFRVNAGLRGLRAVDISCHMMTASALQYFGPRQKNRTLYKAKYAIVFDNFHARLERIFAYTLTQQKLHSLQKSGS